MRTITEVVGGQKIERSKILPLGSFKICQVRLFACLCRQPPLMVFFFLSPAAWKINDLESLRRKKSFGLEETLNLKMSQK